MWAYVLTLVVLLGLVLGLVLAIGRRASGTGRPASTPDPGRLRREARGGVDPATLRAKDRRDAAASRRRPPPER